MLVNVYMYYMYFFFPFYCFLEKVLHKFHMLSCTFIHSFRLPLLPVYTFCNFCTFYKYLHIQGFNGVNLWLFCWTSQTHLCILCTDVHRVCCVWCVCVFVDVCGVTYTDTSYIILYKMGIECIENIENLKCVECIEYIELFDMFDRIVPFHLFCIWCICDIFNFSDIYDILWYFWYLWYFLLVHINIQGTREKWLEEQLARRSTDLVTALYKGSDMKFKYGIKDL